MITTRESINYQFSLIFGYSSHNDEIIAGDIIGPGKLTKERVRELSDSVMKFLRMYNAMLRDYTGSEVFSIEFSLFNVDEKDAQTKIYPKSMIFVPGKYKESESLLLALKPETGVLNTHKSREELIEISRLFSEVEEFTNRPDLKKSEREQICRQDAEVGVSHSIISKFARIGLCIGVKFVGYDQDHPESKYPDQSVP